MEDQGAPDSNDEAEEYTVRHELSEDYRLEPATGITGSIQPQGNVKLDFVIDHNRRLLKETHHYSDEGEVRESAEIDSEFVREHRVGVTMERNDAFEAGAWIIATALGRDMHYEDVISAIENHYELENGED